MIRIYAFRHGPVNVSGVCYGQLDVEPSLSGHTALAQIQSDLKAIPRVDAVWASPLERCRTIAVAFGGAHRLDDRLMEVNFGRWEGMSWTEIHEAYPTEMQRWGDDWYTVAPPRGESAKMLESRVKAWLNGLESGTHLVFTHAGVIRALRVLCLKQSWEAAMNASVAYLGVEMFTFNACTLLES